jgi:two-component system sensor histidine kinase/response regulator
VTSSMLFDTISNALGVDAETARKGQATSSLDTSSIRGSRVLLVEDNEINQQVAVGQLEDIELSLDLAENGAEAVQMVRENDYDAVLMDMQMPIMDGTEATQAIRSEPRFQDLPIIAMTANAMAADKEKCLKAGMDDHIAKPIDPEELVGKLLRWIKRRDDNGPLRQNQSQSSERVDASSTADAPLEIASVEVASALKRTGGNQKRYENLLRRFAQQQENPVDAIRQSLSSGDTATAERMAHSLKGAASTLGVMAVAEWAAKAELAIRDGKDVDATLTSLSEDLASSVQAIHTALTERDKAKDVVVPLDPIKVLETLERLKDLLENDDGEAADLVTEACPTFSGVLTDVEIENLNELVGNFNFNAALKCLSRIVARLQSEIQ